MNYQTIFIVISSIFALISPIVYARSILRGESRPHRTTRFVLLVITILSTATLFAQNDRVAIWLAAISALQAIGIFLISLKYGMGGWSRSDVTCLTVALVGIVLWQTTNNPVLGLYFAILADFTGMMPALLKTYKFPKTETAWFYVLDVFASIFTLFAISHYTAQAIAYPVYIFCINLTMVYLIKRPLGSKASK